MISKSLYFNKPTLPSTCHAFCSSHHIAFVFVWCQGQFRFDGEARIPLPTSETRVDKYGDLLHDPSQNIHDVR